jgi:Predicted O-methyltransferase
MKKQMFYKRILIWLLRFRHRKGYGVHSPFAFNLITGVIYEKAQYYDYEYLSDLIEKTSRKSSSWNRYLGSPKIYEFIFRLANYAHPQTILEIGTSVGASSVYLSCSRKKARFITIDKNSLTNTLATTLFKNYNGNIDFRFGDVSALVPEAISELESLDFLLLHAGDYPLNAVQLMFKQCISKSNAGSVFLIQDIHKSSALKRWWKEIQLDERVGITFDLYDFGIIFFNRKKIKQHYVVNF